MKNVRQRNDEGRNEDNTKHALALLGGLLIMCPEDPLRFLEEKIKEMMERGLYGIIWNMCIDPELSLKLRVLSETYLHTLLGLDDDQLMTTELCDRAWDFYSTNLKRKCFEYKTDELTLLHDLSLFNYCSAWIQYCEEKKAAEELLQKKLAAARHYYDCRLLKLAMRTWYEWVNSRKELHKPWSYKAFFTPQICGKDFLSFPNPVLESEELLFVQPEKEARERRHSERHRSSIAPKHLFEELPTFYMKTGREYFFWMDAFGIICQVPVSRKLQHRYKRFHLTVAVPGVVVQTQVTYERH
ncbi:F-box/LRR-repeat protein 13, partial [Ophiophagus hannah]